MVEQRWSIELAKFSCKDRNVDETSDDGDEAILGVCKQFKGLK
jgi:hypothetical protein